MHSSRKNASSKNSNACSKNNRNCRLMPNSSKTNCCQEQQKMLIQVTDSITNFIKEYNKDGRYEAILNNSSVLYIKPAYNITPEITELLNKRYASKQK